MCPYFSLIVWLFPVAFVLPVVLPYLIHSVASLGLQIPWICFVSQVTDPPELDCLDCFHNSNYYTANNF